jgi:hypothetical protein
MSSPKKLSLLSKEQFFYANIPPKLVYQIADTHKKPLMLGTIHFNPFFFFFNSLQVDVTFRIITG